MDVFHTVSCSLQLPFAWRRNGAEVGFPDYIIGCEEDGKYFCNIVNATAEDEVRETKLINTDLILNCFRSLGLLGVLARRRGGSHHLILCAKGKDK